jgi:hypothetical protein
MSPHEVIDVMDCLTGFQNNNELPDPSEQDSIKYSNNPKRKVDSNSFLPFLEGNINNTANSLCKSSPGHLSFVSELDPTKISDEDFYQSSKKLNNVDFIHAAIWAYLKRATSASEVGILIGDVEGQKDGRRVLLFRLRNSPQFMGGSYNELENLPIVKPIRKFFEQLWFYLSRLIRKITGLESIKIEAFTNLVMEQNAFIIGACIDEGRTKRDENPSRYIVDGWVLTKDSQRCVIRLTCNNKVIAESPLTVSRSDVTSAYCLTSSHHYWGYSMLMDIKDLPERGVMQIKAVFASGELFSVGSIKFHKAFR